MSLRSPRATALFAALVFAAAPLVAQSDSAATLSVNPGVLTKGSQATIRYVNPAMANQTVVIDIDNGARRNGIVLHVEIHLDAKGEGTCGWTVPAWFGANFNAPGVGEVTCPIAQ